MQHTVLVTGAAGFIASHLIPRLLDQGHRVVGIDNFDPFYPKPVKERNLAALIPHAAFHFAEADIRIPSQLAALPDFDTVVHLAAKAGVRPSIVSPQEYIDVNITGTHHLLQLCEARGCRKMAFASSSSIYGNSPHIPFVEEGFEYLPISPYAATKRSNEYLNYTYHHLYGLDILNLRFFTVYGPRQRPDLAIHKFTRLLLEGKPIPMFGDGSTARDYTYVSDTVHGICRALDYLWSHEGVYDIVNLGNQTPVKLIDLIHILGEAVGVRPVIETYPMQEGDVEITYANIEKASRLFGYRPTTVIGEGLRQFVDWFREFEYVK